LHPSGYTVPHPLIPQMNLRVTTTGSPAVDVTAECAQQLIEMLNHMEEVFDGAYERFKSGQ
jgi:DNA-directed RNA polymerase I and III subunit RPAC2